jgi:hypothetical protein
MNKIRPTHTTPHYGAHRLARRFTIRITLLVMAVVGTIALSGCGGGGSSAGGQSARSQAVVTITWPSSTASRLIPAAANSIVVTFTQNGSTVGTETAARPATGTTSTLTFPSLPVGTLTAKADAYPSTDGTGVVQATALVSVEIVSGQVTPVTINMASTIDHLVINPTSPTATVGSTTTLSLSALDANGNIVLVASSAISWISETKTVATVSSTGVVTGVAAGSSLITATDSESGKSVSVTITVSSAGSGPTITTQPGSVVATVGNSASLKVVASGSSLSYKWYKNGSEISGATSASYTISSAATTDIGTYYAVVANSTGSTQSDPATIHVINSYGIWGAYEQSATTATDPTTSFTASSQNESAIWVTDSGSLTLTNPTITTSGNTSSQDYSSFYGLNAGVLASAGTINITGGTVTTTGTGANGVFSTGSGAYVTLSKMTIKCTADGGHAVMATQGGTMKCTNVYMTTAGANSGAIATDRGGGTIIAEGGTVTTTGADSPGIYSTGVITVSGATIKATGSEAAVIEGANSIALTDTSLTGAVKRGVMIYQSMSGDAEGTKGTFTMIGGSLSAAAGPLFYVTNSTGTITITGVTCTAAGGTLVQAAADSWGTSGSNGGTVVFTASGETLTGNMICDSISSITASLQNSTTLTGYINSAALSLDSTSKWNVTANSVLTTLSDTSGISGTTITNIYGNGYTVTYDSSLSGNSALGGKTYTLNGGGALKPE